MKPQIIVLFAMTLFACEAFAQDTASKSPPPGATVAQPATEPVRRDATSANPFPYAVAVEPAREPYRPPVPCSTYARETDGFTTCIGIQDRGSYRPRVAASPKPPRPPRRERVVRRDEPAPERLTDPRFDLAPVMAPPVPNGGDGLLAFLGRLLSR